MYKKLSADPNALIIGIISLLMVFLGCCCGVFALVSFTLSIAGIIIANKSLNEYEKTPDEYDSNSKNNVYIGKLLNIIALIMSSLFVVIYILYFAIVGSVLTSGAFLESIRDKDFRIQQDSISTIQTDNTIQDNDFIIDSLKVEQEKQ